VFTREDVLKRRFVQYLNGLIQETTENMRLGNNAQTYTSGQPLLRCLFSCGFCHFVPASVLKKRRQPTVPTVSLGAIRRLADCAPVQLHQRWHHDDVGEAMRGVGSIALVIQACRHG
jgi:hypothetical protein